MKKYALLFPLMSLFLTGCVATKPASRITASPQPAAQVTLEELPIFTIRGKLGVKHNNEGANANLDWEQNHDSYNVKLTGPLGQGRLEIGGNASQATITDQKGHVIKVASIEDYLHKKLGWYLPVRSWSYWVKGLPSPSEKFTATYHENGKLKTLSQFEWNIEYVDYMATTRGYLPRKLILQRPGTQLRVIIKEWVVE